MAEERFEGNTPDGGKESEGKGFQQYGKKGRKPRKQFVPTTKNVDEIVTNAIEYWNKTSGYSNVTNFAWSQMLGDPIRASILLSGVDFLNDEGFNPAQVMNINFIPGPGWTLTTQDGANRALSQIMAKIRATLSTSNIGFHTADLGIFAQTTASISMLIGLAKRILESRLIWKERNYIYPRGLVAAAGYNWEDISYNINTYAPKLNALIDRYNGMNIPDIFDIYDRQYALVHNVFADEDDDNFAQLYTFTPNGYYTYDDTPEEGGGHIISAHYNQLSVSPYFDGLLDKIEECIELWYASDDLYQINGTLLRAFKEVPRQMIPYFEKDTSISPECDKNHLMQIMNMTILGPSSTFYPDSLNMYQDPVNQNYVKWAPAVAWADNREFMDVSIASHQLLRLYESDVAPEDNMELTRLLNFISPETPRDLPYEHSDDLGWLTHCGSELVTTVDVYAYNAKTDEYTYTDLKCNYIRGTDGGMRYVDLNRIAKLSAFRYLPAVHLYCMDVAGEPDNNIYMGMLGDSYNFYAYNRNDWKNLQFQAYMSLWTPKNINLG